MFIWVLDMKELANEGKLYDGYKSFRKRIYKNSKIKNLLIVSSILVPGIVTIIILLFLDTKYEGLLISMLLILSLFLLTMIYKIFYNLFLFKINEEDAKISIKTDVVGIKFKLYDELYGKYGSKDLDGIKPWDFENDFVPEKYMMKTETTSL